MSALDKLRELDDAASPGPWKVGEGYGARVLFPSVPEARPGWDMADSPLAIDMTDANAQLAALVHLLRPAFEALEQRQDYNGDLVFQVRVSNHGARPYSAREVARRLVSDWEQKVWDEGQPLVRVRLEEPAVFAQLEEALK